MAPIMFAALVVFLLLGYPVAFALSFVGLGFGLIGIALGQFSGDFFHVLPERMWGIVANDTLLAIPFFTFMGLILERRSEEHTSELQSLMRISYAVFCLKK